MGNCQQNFTSDPNSQYLQAYLSEQVEKKRQRMGGASSRSTFLCCNTIQVTFIHKIKWKARFLEECTIQRRQGNFEWPLLLPTFLGSFEPEVSEDGYRTDLILVLFSSSKILFPELKTVDSFDHYEEQTCFKNMDFQLSFKAPKNSIRHTQNSSEENGIDLFTEKASPISKRRDNREFISFSLRNEPCNNEPCNNDSIMEHWKGIDYEEIRDYEIKELLFGLYPDKSAFRLYKIVLERLERHFSDGKNVLGLLLKEYIDYLLNTYQFIDQVLFEKISRADLRRAMDEMITDIHQFSRAFQIALFEFYQFKDLKKKNKELAEFLTDYNLENFVVQLIYQNPEVYDILYESEKHLAKSHAPGIQKAKKLFEGLEIEDCFTPYEKNEKMKMLTPNMRRTDEINTKDSEMQSKGFENFSLAYDHYDNNAFRPFNKYKDLIEGIRFMRNPLEKLMIFSRPRQIIKRFMEDMRFPDFDQLDDRDEIKILLFLILKTDIITVFVELNFIIHSVKADAKELKIVTTILKSLRKLIKLVRRGELETNLKEEGFMAKLIEKVFIQKVDCEGLE